VVAEEELLELAARELPDGLLPVPVFLREAARAVTAELEELEQRRFAAC
jgi:hypothetical protein